MAATVRLPGTARDPHALAMRARSRRRRGKYVARWVMPGIGSIVVQSVRHRQLPRRHFGSRASSADTSLLATAPFGLFFLAQDPGATFSSRALIRVHSG